LEGDLLLEEKADGRSVGRKIVVQSEVKLNSEAVEGAVRILLVDDISL
jgi:hypothetical protein